MHLSGRLDGKRGVVLGVANKHSIAWAITQALAAAGAELTLTYESDRVHDRVGKLADTLEISSVLPCNVADDDEIDALFAELGKGGALDFIVHSVAFAPREALEGGYVDTARAAFHTALDISAYSLVALARAARPLMREGGSILAMTYYGAEKVMPNYNVMGVAKAALEASVRYLASDLGPEQIRVNAISAGPMNTLAARGVSGFTGALKMHAERAPLRRNTEGAELGDTAVYFLSDMGRGVTGEVLYVDGGYHVMGA